MKPISIVIPYKHSYTDELIYTLRSLANFKHKDVWIIGDEPKGVDLDKVHFLPFNQTTDIAKNTLEILNIVCNTPEITEDFIWWHDDMYCMKKTYSLPVYHRGAYDDLINHYRSRMSNFYIRRLRNTNSYLKSIGIERPICYEAHVPFKINKQKWLDLRVNPHHNKLSVYGNVYKIGGRKLEHDVKVRSKDWIPHGNFASSHDATFGSNSLGNKIREIFKTKGEYEI